MSEQLKKSSLLGGIDIDHDFVVRIPFEITLEPSTSRKVLNNWNEHCATAIEMFGLPGDKYTCRLTDNNMEFWFRDEKDAMVFELCCG
jgi:hypothetical protein